MRVRLKKDVAQLKLMNVVGRIIGYHGERAIFGKDSKKG